MPAIFTNDASTTPMTLIVTTTDATYVGVYNFKVTGSISTG